jgi:hypothetical protein
MTHRRREAAAAKRRRVRYTPRVSSPSPDPSVSGEHKPVGDHEVLLEKNLEPGGIIPV